MNYISVRRGNFAKHLQQINATIEPDELKNVYINPNLVTNAHNSKDILTHFLTIKNTFFIYLTQQSTLKHLKLNNSETLSENSTGQTVSTSIPQEQKEKIMKTLLPYMFELSSLQVNIKNKEDVLSQLKDCYKHNPLEVQNLTVKIKNSSEDFLDINFIELLVLMFAFHKEIIAKKSFTLLAFDVAAKLNVEDDMSITNTVFIKLNDKCLEYRWNVKNNDVQDKTSEEAFKMFIKNKNLFSIDITTLNKSRLFASEPQYTKIELGQMFFLSLELGSKNLFTPVIKNHEEF